MAPSKKQQTVQKSKKINALAWAQQQDKGFESTYLKMPPGVEEFKPDPGVYNIDILPYKVGDYNQREDKGEPHFEMQYDVHKLASMDGRTNRYVCLGCARLPCPICQRYNRPRVDDDPNEIKSWKPQTRHLWIFCNVDDKRNKVAPGSFVQIYDSNHWAQGAGFGEQIINAITSNPDYGGFADLEDGMTLRLTVREQSFPRGKWNAVTRIDFVPRKQQYDPSILDSMPCLDDCLILKPAAELKAILEQTPAEEPAPVSRKSAPAEEVESNGVEEALFTAGQMVDHRKFGRCRVVRYSLSDGVVSLKDKGGEGLVRNGIDPEDCVLVEEDAPPAKHKGVHADKPEPKEVDDDGEDDVDFDDED
jgi:hypothetical protein